MAPTLHEKVTELAREFEVPGVAVGVWSAGQESYAYAGVTSVDNPLPVDGGTLFQFGSTGKTYTSSALLRLVERGDVDLDAPVRRYLPDFKLRDDEVARTVTVLQLLNHTAGWEGDMMDHTGDGDDALAKYVALMEKLVQVNQPGEVVSYNNASLSVAGLIIERITGTTYEKAIRDLLLAPLGLDATYFFPNDVMTRRFVVGHRKDDQTGKITVSRPWALPRGNSPAGGMSATARDQIGWARFHLGGGVAPDGTRLLSAEMVARMQQPTVSMPGSALGDHVGISWLLREADGVKIVAHGGTTIGQHSEFVMAPERDFAVISMTNCGPNGPRFNDEVVRWALEHYAGIVERDPEPVSLPDEALAAYVGRYETIAVTCDITSGDGRLTVTIKVKPEMAEVLREAGEDPDEPQPPIPLALLASDGDKYIVPEGDAKGMKGYFVRGDDGTVTGVHMGGRLATRVAA
ncbi:MAG TPA: serine hydrolase domain-containing protein [Micromonosporaceae bacterium]|nr:serine hydrolase domain-containing protein [Micromonosporaceae bacterium]